MTSSEMPAFSGREGPGLMTMPSNALDSISSTVISSLRATSTSAPSWHRYW